MKKTPYRQFHDSVATQNLLYRSATRGRFIDYISAMDLNAIRDVALWPCMYFVRNHIDFIGGCTPSSYTIVKWDSSSRVACIVAEAPREGRAGSRPDSFLRYIVLDRC